MANERAEQASIRRVVVSGEKASIRVERLELPKEIQRQLTTGVRELDPVRKSPGNNESPLP